MRVKDLVEELMALPEEAEIWLAHDEEGNQFSPLDDRISTNRIFLDETSLPSIDWEADDVGLTEEEWEEVKKEQPQIIILWPGWI